MTHAPQHTTSASTAGLAHLGAVLGPLIPLAVWVAKKDSDPWAAREAGKAVNFGLMVFVVFAVATVVRKFVPFVAFIGTLAQLAVLVVAIVLCYQAFRAVRRGLPATYPYNIEVVKRND
ncbi:DUF4870 domain-containing protein [Demequina sp.]|uniref:DUF4870 domain-containing protein n=1 Tax=Demequina sp. TaxID=2050685 RepID=UPI003A849616